MEITKDNIETTISIEYSIWNEMDIKINFFVTNNNGWLFFSPSVTYLSIDNTLLKHEYIDNYTYKCIIDHIKSITGLEPTKI